MVESNTFPWTLGLSPSNLPEIISPLELTAFVLFEIACTMHIHCQAHDWHVFKSRPYDNYSNTNVKTISSFKWRSTYKWDWYNRRRHLYPTPTRDIQSNFTTTVLQGGVFSGTMCFVSAFPQTKNSLNCFCLELWKDWWKVLYITGVFENVMTSIIYYQCIWKY